MKKPNKRGVKFFQYLIGEHQGEVTVLDYIDDTMPDIGIFYCFNDGFKCNAELIGELGDADAFKNNCVLAQIPSMNNKWEFSIKETKPQEKKDINDNGESVVGADPYFFGKDGQQLASAKKQIIATPPYLGGVVSQEEKDLSMYYLSTPNSDLDDIATSDNSMVIISPEVLEHEKKTITHQEALQFANASIVQSLSNDSFNMPEQKIIIEGYEFTKELYEEFLEYCKQKRINEEQKTENEQSPIKILLDKTKVNRAVIDTKVTMQLPPVQLYNIVHELYGEEGAIELVHRIVKNTTCEMLQSAIAESVIDFYSKPTVTTTE